MYRCCVLSEGAVTAVCMVCCPEKVSVALLSFVIVFGRILRG